mmetsp:Transcript_16488/g.24833  ORF Transcript_16488/g.24833 Transcript_16488/m.24833 type:complete len:81 (+) Transcript_16488:340-582(+)
MTAVEIAHQNDRHIVFCGKYELIASKLNSTPPKGAPKAAVTPAAQEAENISLFFASLFRYLGKRLMIRAPQQQAMCTMGP